MEGEGDERRAHGLDGAPTVERRQVVSRDAPCDDRAVRTLTWYHGRAWIAEAPDAWPASLRWASRTEAQQRVALPASARGAAAAVAVQRVCQTASGGSFFARLGAALTPSEEGVLEVIVTLADDPDMTFVLPAVLAGLEAMPASDRPAGRLELAWFVIHPVDLKVWAWRNAAATMVRLLCADVSALDDGAAAALAQAYTVGLPAW